ncbi:MAG: 50S ribosomal protein L6 [Anaerolineaceae bacterium]|nr:50S ribosomal protein L6 [Anaerolineaceae bacterium]
MSRVGRLPVTVPSGVQVNISGQYVSVKGPKGSIERTFAPGITIQMEDGHIIVQRESDIPTQRALHGTTRAVINNMVIGVSTGFATVLEIEGVGYRAEMSGNDLVLYVGYSHTVTVNPPEGITFEVDTKTRQIKVLGFDKEQVGQVAANVRSIRPPEPYHGKGIRYLGEKVRRKAGKSGKGKK